jgi:hypothetical protein
MQFDKNAYFNRKRQKSLDRKCSAKTSRDFAVKFESGSIDYNVHLNSPKVLNGVMNSENSPSIQQQDKPFRNEPLSPVKEKDEAEDKPCIRNKKSTFSDYSIPKAMAKAKTQKSLIDSPINGISANDFKSKKKANTK